MSLHRKRRETKQQPSMLPGPAVPGCCLVSFRFLCDIHSIHTVQCSVGCGMVVSYLGWVDFDLGVPPCCPTDQPILRECVFPIFLWAAGAISQKRVLTLKSFHEIMINFYCLRFEQLQGMGTARNRIPNSLAVNNRSVYCLAPWGDTSSN